MDLAGREGEVDAVVGDDAGEALDDAAELDGRHRVGRRPSVPVRSPGSVDAGGRLAHALAPSGIGDRCA